MRDPHPFVPCQDPLACSPLYADRCHFAVDEYTDCDRPSDDPVHQPSTEG